MVGQQEKASSFRSEPGFQPKHLVGGYEPHHELISVGGGGQQVYTNAFQARLKEGASIGVFSYSLEPCPEPDSAIWRTAIETAWPDLEKEFSAFAFAPLAEHAGLFDGPRHLFVPGQRVRREARSLPFQTNADGKDYLLRVTFVQLLTAEEVNGFKHPICFKLVGLFQQWLKKSFTLNRCRCVGDRYFEEGGKIDEPGSSKGNVYKLAMPSFGATLAHTAQSGMVAFLDSYKKVIDPHNVVDSMAADLLVEAGDKSRDKEKDKEKDREAKAKPEDTEKQRLEFVLDRESERTQFSWLQKVVGKTVTTDYNWAVYKIEAVLFDQTPQSSFMFKEKTEQGKTERQTTYEQYVKEFYGKTLKYGNQPLLKAVPQNKKESCILIPELCFIMGIHGESKTATHEFAKIGPADRFKAASSRAEKLGSQIPKKYKLHDEWQLELAEKPVETTARQLNSVKVQFQDEVEISDGDFSKSIKTGLYKGVSVNKWLVICPKALEMWLETLDKLAQPIHIDLATPKILTLETIKDIPKLEKLLEENITDETEFVLLMSGLSEGISEKDLTVGYTTLKRFCCLKKPVPCQFMRSDVLKRSRKSLKYLIRFVLQIAGKVGGQCWKVEFEIDKVKPFLSTPTMCIGIDVFCNNEGEKCLSFVASMGRHCLEYYSLATMVPKDATEQICEKLQEFMREAILEWGRRNEDLLPEHFIVYRGSARAEDLELIQQSEVQAILRFLAAVKPTTRAIDPSPPPTSSTSSSAKAAAPHPGVRPYDPTLHFLAVPDKVDLRFYRPDESAKGSAPAADAADAPSVSNVKPGIVIDDPKVMPWGYPSFYMVNCEASAGVPVPSCYSLLHPVAAKSGEKLPTAAALQELTYRLSYGYYNVITSVRLPAPLQYARKLSEFVGTYIKEEPHARLRSNLYYL